MKIPTQFLSVAYLLPCLMLPISAWCQTSVKGRLIGRVCEENSDPCKGLPKIKVRIINEVSGADYFAVTEKDGSYTIQAVDPGRYYIQAEPVYNSAEWQAFYSHKSTTVGKLWPVQLSKPTELPPPPIIYLKKKAANKTGGLEFGLLAAISIDSLASPMGDPGEDSRAEGSGQSSPGAPNVDEGAALTRRLNTVNATRDGNFGRGTIATLPLPGIRTVESLAFLLPGVAPPPQTLSQTPGPGIGSGVGTSGQFAVNGLRSRANNFTIDGSDNNDEDIGVRRQGFTTLLSQSVESVQEIYIATLLPTPQFGRNLGAQVNLISRSGTLSYHGALYGFFTNDRLKARDFFDLTNDDISSFLLRRTSDNAEAIIFNDQPLAPPNPVGGKDAYLRRQVGFVLGGPVGKQEPPQIGNDGISIKNKLLFFTSFEHQAINADKESHFAVPDIASRGLFGRGDRGLDRSLFNPQEQGPLYPASVVGSAAFSFYPFPNNPRGPYGKNTFTQILPADARGSVFSARLDRTLSSGKRTDNAFRNSQTLTGRYNFTDDDTVLPTTGGALFSSLRALVRTQNLSLFHNYSFSQHVTNEFRGSYGRTALSFREVPNPILLRSNRFKDEPFLLNAQLISNATLPISPVTDFCKPGTILGQPCFIIQPFQTEEDIILGPIGQVLISGYSPVGVDIFNFPQQRVNNTFQYADTLFYNRGRHLIATGFDFRRTQLNSKLDRNFRPLITFSGAADIASDFGFSRRSPTGYYLGSDFAAVGAPTGFFQTFALVPDSTIGLRYWQTDFFFSDEIRVNTKLTLTAGLRYQRNTVPGEVNQRIEDTFNSPQVREFFRAERELTNGTSGFEKFLAGRTKIFRADNDNFAPHFAFAWSPFDKRRVAIRGGYGIYFDQIPGAVTSQSRNVFPNFLTVNLAGLTRCDRDGAAPCPFTNDFLALNPSRLASKLNTYDSSRFGDDLVAFLRLLNRFTAPPVPGRPSGVFPGGPGFVLPAVDLRTPYSQHLGLTVEYEFNNDFYISIAYAGTRGVNLIRFATPNLGPNVIPVVTSVRPNGFEPVFQGFTVAPKKDSLATKFERPFPFLGSFTSIESDASSTYHSLQAEFQKRLSHGIQFTTAYTWSHAIDEVSDIFDLASGPALPQNSFDRRAESASASFDIRHSFVYSLVWDLPTSSSSRLLKDWRISSIGTFRTGQPFTLLACCDVNLDGNLSDRLNTDAGITQVNQGPVRFTAPDDQFGLLAKAGTNGLLGRNTFRAPGTAVIDLAVNKALIFKDRYRLDLRAEFFNLFNRTHFGTPVHQLLFPGLGQSVDTRLPARSIQLAGKFNF